MSKKSPWDFAKTINETKENLMDSDEFAEKEYNSFLVNKIFGQFPDTVLISNEMNKYSFLDDRMKYEFLLAQVRKKKRWSKWVKKEKFDKIEIIKEYFGYSNSKAKEVVDIITDKQFEKIKASMETGGSSKGR